MIKRLTSIISIILPIIAGASSMYSLGLLFFTLSNTKSIPNPHPSTNLQTPEFFFAITIPLVGILFGAFSLYIAKYTRKLLLSPRVFISYSHTDAQLAKQLADAFRQDGAKVWIDSEKIQLGENIVQSIEKGLQQANFLVVLISGTDSRYLEQEVAIARKKGIRVLPVLLNSAAVPDVLRDVKYLSFDEADPTTMIKTIVQAVT